MFLFDFFTRLKPIEEYSIRKIVHEATVGSLQNISLYGAVSDYNKDYDIWKSSNNFPHLYSSEAYDIFVFDEKFKTERTSSGHCQIFDMNALMTRDVYLNKKVITAVKEKLTEEKFNTVVEFLFEYAAGSVLNYTSMNILRRSKSYNQLEISDRERKKFHVNYTKTYKCILNFLK